MKDLSKYYGKDLYYVVTKLQNGKINITNDLKTVYNPKVNFNIGPADGCDLVIGNNSANSNDIFELNGIKKKCTFSYSHYNSIMLINYCEPDNLSTVLNLHIKEIKSVLTQFNTEQTERIKQTKNILKSL